MNLLPRDSIAKLLCVNPKHTYLIFKHNECDSGVILEDVAINFLNKKRVNIPKKDALSQLYTAKEMLAFNPGHTIKGESITEEDIYRLARRKVFPLPHYRLGRKTLRFPRFALSWWLLRKSIPLSRRGEYDEQSTREWLARNSR